MTYLYRHIRIDENVPFYIGIGSDSEGKYKRAFSRNKFWKIIAKKQRVVEIILDELTWKDACIKEKEFIQLYRRMDIGKGSLGNMSDGGVINMSAKKREEEKRKNNYTVSDETKLKLSIAAKKRWNKDGQF